MKKNYILNNNIKIIVLSLCLVTVISLTLLLVITNPVKADGITPQFECPVCEEVSYFYNCYDSQCVNSPDGPHGVYVNLRCLDCDGYYRMYTSFCFCHNLC